jgi:hypothetical protein
MKLYSNNTDYYSSSWRKAYINLSQMYEDGIYVGDDAAFAKYCIKESENKEYG